jgi:hypothetical protein
MRAAFSPIVIREPVPFGDVPLAPEQMTGVSEAELARAMAEHLLAAQPDSPSQALRFLRRAFPGSPLTTRAAALAALMGR